MDSPDLQAARERARELHEGCYECHFACDSPCLACQGTVRAILEAQKAEAERAAREAGGWTGAVNTVDINTVDNARTVSAVCRAISNKLRGRVADLQRQIEEECKR